jgi:HAMP domain-containing protein
MLAVVLASAALALAAALYVSGHVTANLRAISEAMMRLAAGDRQTRLPRGEGQGDEIGKLFHAFRAFRANALRLDRSHRQMAQRTALL